MSEADKLFKELGFKITYGDNILIKNDYIELIFQLKGKCICIEVEDYHYMEMDELKAINMKCKELGWEE